MTQQSLQILTDANGGVVTHTTPSLVLDVPNSAVPKVTTLEFPEFINDTSAGDKTGSPCISKPLEFF
jgi:hypothetical protein